MKKEILNCTIALLLLLSFLSCVQQVHKEHISEDDVPPEIATYFSDFDKRFRKASFFYQYDIVAWISSDSVSAALQRQPELREKLGMEWFCIERGDDFHSYYGKYLPEEDRYDLTFHYTTVRTLKTRTDITNVNTIC